MKKLVYSPHYKKKLSEIKEYLDIQFGEEIRKRILRQITNRLHMLLKYEMSGVSLKELYGIDTEYRYVFVAHNYIFYRITEGSIQIVMLYNKHEDYMYDFFGISSVDKDSEAYWDTIETERK